LDDLHDRELFPIFTIRQQRTDRPAKSRREQTQARSHTPKTIDDKVSRADLAKEMPHVASPTPGLMQLGLAA
jgi:hypothetical protein